MLIIVLSIKVINSNIAKSKYSQFSRKQTQKADATVIVIHSCSCFGISYIYIGNDIYVAQILSNDLEESDIYCPRKPLALRLSTVSLTASSTGVKTSPRSINLFAASLQDIKPGCVFPVNL